MWNILGEEAIYLDIPYKFKSRVLALAADDENGKKFKGLMDKADVSFMINGDSEECCFIIKVPDEYTPEDIQLMADAILDVIKSEENLFVVSLDDQYQPAVINIRADKEPELIGNDRTDGFGSGQIFQPIFDSLSSPGRMNEGFM